MDQAEKKRKLILGGALIATLAAMALVEEEEEDVVATGIVENVQPAKTASNSKDRTRNQESSTELLDVGKLGQRKFNPLAGELFASTTWAPKQPQISLEEQIARAEQAKKAAPPPAPTAPPLQFKYSGKAVTDNETWVFLSQSGEHHITKVGGKINSQYRLDSINDSTVTVTYLPLNVKQTLTINNKIAGTFR
ncbi:MAG: hypothetical protein KGN35_11945 [Betaproteobacteria bacterium]|nr:hypothetical protein [Betaproteobacteria bacterium]